MRKIINCTSIGNLGDFFKIHENNSSFTELFTGCSSCGRLSDDFKIPENIPAVSISREEFLFIKENRGFLENSDEKFFS